MATYFTVLGNPLGLHKANAGSGNQKTSHVDLKSHQPQPEMDQSKRRE